MWLLIPEGKTLLVKVGNYKFVGPRKLSLQDKFHLPETFTDGTPIKGYFYDEQPNPNDGIDSPILDNSQRESEGERGDSGSGLGDSVVREDSGSDDESEILRQQLSQTVRSVGRRRKVEDSGDKTESDS